MKHRLQDLHDPVLMAVIAVDAHQAQERFQQAIVIDGDEVGHGP